MNIALIAHDAKKELMVQFCIAYCGILSRHNLCATGTTGKLVSEATGLKITCFMAGSQGGDQQISSRISCNEIDLLLYFRNPIGAKATEPDEASLLRLCDVYNIPYATNIGLGRGHDPRAGKRRPGLARYRQPQKVKTGISLPRSAMEWGILLFAGSWAQPPAAEPPLRPKAAGTAPMGGSGCAPHLPSTGTSLFPKPVLK